jgi:hypothetical protein
MNRIYADFNNVDAQGRVRLNCVGSMKDIDNLASDVRSGAKVLLYTPGELEVEALLEFDAIWVAIPDWTTIRYLETT